MFTRTRKRLRPTDYARQAAPYHQKKKKEKKTELLVLIFHKTHNHSLLSNCCPFTPEAIWIEKPSVNGLYRHQKLH